MYTHVSRLLAAAAALAIASIAAAETPISPTQLPPTWQYTPQYVQDAEGDLDWWSSFADPTLDSLLTIGLERNYDVLSAQRRMEIARQTLNEARSLYFPTLTLNAGWTAQRTPGAITGTHDPSRNTSYFSLGADMSWQVDIFGKITAQVRQQKEMFRATRAQTEGTRVSMAAQIATTYMQLRVLQLQQLVADEHLKSQGEVLNIAEARHEAGLADALDVAQAQTVYYQTQASIPALTTSITQTVNALAVLLAVEPSQLPTSVTVEAARLPDYSRLVANMAPVDLLRRRPDIAQAEATIAADAAALGLAKKEWLPTLSLSGSVGVEAHDIGNLFKRNAFTYAIAPTLSWTAFDGMHRRYAIEAARQQMLADIDQYNLTVLNAVSEVNNALAAYVNALQEIEMYQKVVDAAGKALKLSVDLYRGGLTAFVNVADSQLNYLTYTNSLITARGDALNALVSIYKAMGGGWQQQ